MQKFRLDSDGGGYDDDDNDGDDDDDDDDDDDINQTVLPCSHQIEIT